jgi:molybdenum cofactor cytidylyltransferase
MGRPKALLPFRGKSFLGNILEAISVSSIRHTVVVIGHNPEQVQPLVAPPARVVFNPEYEQGMVTSLQAGIRALPAGASGAMLFLVDHPCVDHETIELLIARLEPNRIVVPVFEGRRGHPVLFASNILGEILALSASEGANIVVRKDPSRIIHTPVKSPGILVDIDTPEDFQKLQSEYEPR